MAVKFKRTKIIASLGPASDSPETIEKLIRAGVNGARLNMSHGTREEHSRRIQWVREASEATSKPVAVIADLQGPKLRIGSLPEDGIRLREDEEVCFAYGADYTKEGIIPLQYDLSDKVAVGDLMFLFDGKLCVQAIEVSDRLIRTQVKTGGKLTSRKGINLPDTDLAGDILTHKDYEDIEFILGQDVDYIALSFVQHASDVEQLQAMLRERGSDIKVIAKIETKAALDNVEEIVEVSDGVMVARGDLATEAGPEVIPIAQRKIIGLAQQHAKLVVVATQMLASMTDSSQPTRAEVADIATAVICGADGLMLSEETAIGKYPVEAVKLMKKVSLYAEQNSPVEPLFIDMNSSSQGNSIAAAAVKLSRQMGAKLIIAETATGRTARNIASHRPQMPIIMTTNDRRVWQQLAIVYGGKSYYFEDVVGAGSKAIEVLCKRKNLHSGDIAVLTYGSQPGATGGTDTIKIREVE